MKMKCALQENTDLHSELHSNWQKTEFLFLLLHMPNFQVLKVFATPQAATGGAIKYKFATHCWPMN